MTLSRVMPFLFLGGGKGKVRVSLGEQLREIWRQATGTAGMRDGGECGRCGGGTKDAGDAIDFDAGAVSGEALAQADTCEPAPFCGDAGGAAGDQRDQGSHCGDGLAGSGAARGKGRGRDLRGARS